MLHKVLLFLAMGIFLTGIACQQQAGDWKQAGSAAFDGGTVIIKTESGELRKGPNALVVEILDTRGDLLPAENASMSAVMPMPGMSPMTTSISLQAATQKGRFTGKAEFDMSGSWQFSAELKLPVGSRQTSFNLNVR